MTLQAQTEHEPQHTVGTGRILDVLSAEFAADPYDQYDQLLAAGPLHRDRHGVLFACGHDVVTSLLRDTSMSSAGAGKGLRASAKAAGLDGDLDEHLANWLVWHDPPDHTRLRRLMNRAFTPRAVASLTPRIEAVVDDLLDAVTPGTPFDFVDQVAFPLPALIICELLGVPTEDRDRCRKWSEDIVRLIDLVIDPAAFRRAESASEAFSEFFVELIARRRAEPDDDVLSELLAAQAEDKLTDAELIANVVFLFAAGHETTTNLLASGVLALHRHPDELARLRENPGLTESAVEELLRLAPPVHMTVRTTTTPTIAAGHHIAAGTVVVLLLAAANRDPTVFPHPQRLDLSRGGPRPMSFGLGTHFCLGAPLARSETRVALRRLLDRWSTLTIDEDTVRWRTTMNVRGPERLEIIVHSEEAA